jgi:lipoprotein-releasing system permease protein
VWYETFIGWRYLYYRPVARSRLLVGVFLSLVGLLALSGLFLVLTRRPPPMLVFGFTAVAIATIVVGLLNVFSVFVSVAVFGVVLGTCALTLVLSVTSGFQASFKQKVLGVNAHVIVMKNASDFRNYRDIESLGQALRPEVVAIQPFLMSEMLITRGKGELSGVLLKGVDPDRLASVLDLPQHMVEGSVDVLRERAAGEPPALIVGRELAHKLNKAKVGDTVTLVLPTIQQSFRRGSGTMHPPKQRKFRIGGIFYSGFQEYDSHLIYVDIKEAQDFLGEGDSVLGVEMRVRDVERAHAVAKRLSKQLGADYSVMDWHELNNNLFTALMLQKIALVVFLTLIILVAAFNMVASLTMMVLDKTKEIAILKSMGATSGGLATVFEVVGLTIGGIGTTVGLALGIALGKVVAKYGYPLDPKVYLIDQLPIQVNAVESILVGIITMVICFVATLYPALKASSLRPVEGLRYE